MNTSNGPLITEIPFIVEPRPVEPQTTQELIDNVNFSGRAEGEATPEEAEEVNRLLTELSERAAVEATKAVAAFLQDFLQNTSYDDVLGTEHMASIDGTQVLTRFIWLVGVPIDGTVVFAHNAKYGRHYGVLRPDRQLVYKSLLELNMLYGQATIRKMASQLMTATYVADLRT